jgi:hypothetical protein
VAAIDFPDSPEPGETFTVGSRTWRYVDGVWQVEASGGGGASIVVSETAPESPSQGDLWYDSASGETYIFYDNFWVEVGSSSNVPRGNEILVSFNGFSESADVSIEWNNKIIEFTGSSPANLTIPPNSSVNFPRGFSVTLIAAGNGALTFVSSLGVTLLSKNSNTVLSSQYGVATLVQTDIIDTWYLFGDISS